MSVCIRIREILLAGLLVLVCGAVDAHDLKVFAAVDDGVLQGYAFFGGGGRARAARLIIRDEQGNELFRGGTDVDGAFRFRPAAPTALVVIVDVGDGHAAKTRIPAARFASNEVLSAMGAAQAQGSESRHSQNPAANPAELSVLIERSVERAVARQIAPLLEASATAEGRLRFKDVLSGVALIMGLAGMLLWVRSRPRGRTDAQGGQ